MRSYYLEMSNDDDQYIFNAKLYGNCVIHTQIYTHIVRLKHQHLRQLYNANTGFTQTFIP